MEVSGRLHASVALTHGIEFPLPVVRGLVGCDEENKILSPAWNGTPVLQPVILVTDVESNKERQVD
jgi:hypothetical protein